jgi:hypothetical protein
LEFLRIKPYQCRPITTCHHLQFIINRQCITMSSSRTLASSPSLPLELLEEEILCRLPVKILLQLRCICKSWKSLISDDPKFAKKHLRMSKILNHQHNHHHIVFSTCPGQILCDSPLSSVSTNVSNPTVTQTQLNIPISNIENLLLRWYPLCHP